MKEEEESAESRDWRRMRLVCAYRTGAIRGGRFQG